MAPLPRPPKPAKRSDEEEEAPAKGPPQAALRRSAGRRSDARRDGRRREPAQTEPAATERARLIAGNAFRRFDPVSRDFYHGYLGQSLLKRAIGGPGRCTSARYPRLGGKRPPPVDDRPFGGGPGMVLKVGPVVECVEAMRSPDPPPGHLVMLTPQGRRLDQPAVERLAQQTRLLLLCGRYEGFDERIRLDSCSLEEISLGDFVLNGGEMAAMVAIDAVIRLVPGVLGDEDSRADDSFAGESAMAGVRPVHAAPRVSPARGSRGAVQRKPRRNRRGGKKTAASERWSGERICSTNEGQE